MMSKAPQHAQKNRTKIKSNTKYKRVACKVKIPTGSSINILIKLRLYYALTIITLIKKLKVVPLWFKYN